MSTDATPLTRPASWDGGLYLRDDAVRDMYVDDAAPYYGRTVSGYGSKIPTRYRLALANSRTRRVYAMAYGNGASVYVIIGGAVALLKSDTEHNLTNDRALEMWLRFNKNDDEEPTYEANVYREPDGTVSVRWSLVAVGLVTTVPCSTRDAAREWLASAGYVDFTA